MLWLSAALGAIAFSVATTVRGETERASTAVDSTRAYYLATGALHRAAIVMIGDARKPLTPDAPRRHWPGYPLMGLEFPTGSAMVEIIPETAKIDVNNAPPDLLRRLLMAMGVDPLRAEDIAGGILDWRGGTPGSSYDQFYLSLTPSFRGRHASLEEIEELLSVRGVTPDLFYGGYDRVPLPGGKSKLVRRVGLVDCLSVYGTLGEYDANTAPAPVLIAAGGSPETVAMLLQRRQTAPFRLLQEFQEFRTQLGPTSGVVRFYGRSMYTLRATARPRTASGGYSDLRRAVSALVKFNLNTPPYTILRWNDNAWSPL